MSSEGDSSIPWVGMPLIASADVAAPYREDQIRPYHVFYYQDPYNIWQSPHVSTHAQLSRRLRRFDPTPNGRRTEKSKDDLQLPSLQDWYPSVNLSGRVFRARDTLIEVNLGNKDAMTVRTLRDNLISTSAVCPEQSSSRLMMWQDIRDNCILYPVTIYSLWAILATCSRSKLLEAISTWTIWNPVKTVVDHDVIRASICQFIPEIRRGQKLMINQALNRDLIDLSALVERTISSTAMRDIILSLSESDIQRLMGVLQMLIEAELVPVPSKRTFERFIGTIVKQRNLFPDSLFVTNAKRLGRNPQSGGGFADVWRGELQGKPIAMKVLRMYQFGKSQLENVHQKFCEEAWLWQRLKHQNVLPFYGVCKDEFSPMLAMISPWMENGNLVTYLQEHNLNAFDRRGIVQGVATGLHFLHSLKPVVVHGDLRAGNVLIDSGGKPRIADFGLARIIDSQASSVVATSFNGKGTMRWQAPELLNASRFGVENNGVTTKSDVYAFACVCWEIFTGQVPFSNLRDGEVILAVAVNDKRPSRPTDPATSCGLDDEHWKLMKSCWATQPVDRPSMEEVNDILHTLSGAPSLQLSSQLAQRWPIFLMTETCL